MFNSMFIGLSGMRAFSDGLRQVSNNITNLNSAGFKSSDVGFGDLFTSGSHEFTLSGQAHSPGQGVRMADGRIDFRQGELRQSENDLDLAIDGAGMLVLEKDGQFFYTRTGSFEVRDDGFIFLAGTDYRLTVIDDDGNPKGLSIDAHRISQPEATTSIKFADNLSSTATEYSLATINVYNAVGQPDAWEVKFERNESDPTGEWQVKVTTGTGVELEAQTLRFLSGIVDPLTRELTFTHEDRTVVFDFSEGVSSFSSGSVSTLRAADVDGYAVGEITSLLVNDKGELEINYSNEKKHSLGYVTLASFRDLQSLEQRSGGIFVYNGEGGRDFLTSESERVGQVLSRRIEASNVDLSDQFGDLILVQRGYQASSQVVSISNEMIQQLFGLRGQG